jgi:hypothetical protein
VPFKVRSVHVGVADALRWHLEPFRRAQPDPGAIDAMIYVAEEDEGSETPPLSYFRGPERLFSHPDPQRLFRYAVWDIHYSASQFVRSFLALHAGAASADGQGLLLPAPQETGKSTIVAALLQRGFNYLSDEVGALDPITRRMYPHPKLLHLDPDAVDLFPGLEGRLEDRKGRARSSIERTVRPSDLDAGVGGPAPVRWVVFMSRDRQGPPRLTPVARAEAVEQMAENAFNLYRYGDRGVVLLARIAEGAETFRIDGGTALERADLLAERFRT